MLGDVGPVGSIIRASVRTVAQNLAPFLSHKIANQVLKDLAVAGNSTGRVRGRIIRREAPATESRPRAGPNGQERPASPSEPAPRCQKPCEQLPPS